MAHGQTPIVISCQLAWKPAAVSKACLITCNDILIILQSLILMLVSGTVAEFTSNETEQWWSFRYILIN